jgi:uncharacterized protein YukE
MSWYNPVDVIKGAVNGVSDVLGGGGQTQTTTAARSVLPRDTDTTKIWNDFMSSYGNLSGDLSGQSSYLDSAFSDYSKSIGSSNTQYQSTLNNLISGLNSDENKISFGMEGSSPVSFTSKQDRENAELLSTLAGNILSSKSTLPTATYAEAKDNNPYTAKLKLYDLISELANQNEDRRYGLATTTTKDADTSNTGLLDMLTSLGSLGSATSGLSSLGSATGLSGLLGTIAMI